MSELNLDHTSTQELNQTQSSDLSVSPKQLQALELLEHSNKDISKWITEKLAENPLLERREPNEEIELPDEELENSNTELDNVDLNDLSYRSNKNFRGQKAGGTKSNKNPENALRSTAKSQKTLHDSLTWQLSLRSLPSDKRELAKFLISHIDEDGRFQGDLTEIAREKDVLLETLESILKLIQQFDPPGVGGRSLSETLLIQLRRETEDLDKFTEEIITEYLQEVQNRSFKKIAKQVGTDPDEVRKLADRVRDLEPRPGRAFETERAQCITPDVIIRKLEDSRAIIINDEAPPLTINSQYRSLLDSDDDETSGYVEEKLEGALWIIHCIHQRRETLYKVTNAIADFQSDFLENGAKQLKPLKLEDVANVANVHKTTVGRAINDKHVQTNQGLYPMDYFFPTEIKTDDDTEPTASTAVKAIISELINEEDSSDPLSDGELKDKLHEQGIRIHRRTISKYRNEMAIPPKRLRKKIN